MRRRGSSSSSPSTVNLTTGLLPLPFIFHRSLFLVCFHFDFHLFFIHFTLEFIYESCRLYVCLYTSFHLIYVAYTLETNHVDLSCFGAHACGAHEVDHARAKLRQTNKGLSVVVLPSKHLFVVTCGEQNNRRLPCKSDNVTVSMAQLYS